MLQAPLIGLSRHRLSVDGEGVTTLVAFHGCPLRCHYCLNARCLRPDGILRTVTTGELAGELAVDNLYFLATGGGVTFGGGEPCLRSTFIEEFATLADPRWKINIESSLNVSTTHLRRLLPIVHQWIVDVKDCNPDIYRARQPSGHHPSPLAALPRRHGRPPAGAVAPYTPFQHRCRCAQKPLVS